MRRVGVLLVTTCVATGVNASQRDIIIAVDGLAAPDDYERGIQLGFREAERAATLLGHRVRRVTQGHAVAKVQRAAPARSDVPVIAMSGTSAEPCVFVTTSNDVGNAAGGGTITDWHPAFRRYGASQLNERYEKAFGRAMTSEAWHGWVAVKAVFEAALRGEDVCAELARLRFDGHKGRALRFDSTTRRLMHPALVIRREGGKEVVEVVP